MDKEKIKEQLLDYNRQFKRMSGAFKSFEIVFDYMSFLASEPYVINILKPLVDYIEKEAEILDEQATKDLQNLIIDYSTLDGLTKIPIFKDKFAIWQEDFNNGRDPNIMAGIHLYLILLVEVAGLIQEIKDLQKSGDTEQAKKLIEVIKEKSLSVVDTKNIKGYEMKRMTYGQYIDISMELVNKLIIDEIDSQALLDNEKPKAQVYFDKEKSILYYRGKPIKIAKQKRLPVEHFILECIFSKEDISDPADFSEISRDFIKEEYDKSKKWSYRSACDNLNEKVRIGTNSVVDKFIEYSLENLGSCNINRKYL